MKKLLITLSIVLGLLTNTYSQERLTNEEMSIIVNELKEFETFHYYILFKQDSTEYSMVDHTALESVYNEMLLRHIYYLGRRKKVSDDKEMLESNYSLIIKATEEELDKNSISVSSSFEKVALELYKSTLFQEWYEYDHFEAQKYIDTVTSMTQRDLNYFLKKERNYFESGNNSEDKYMTFILGVEKKEWQSVKRLRDKKESKIERWLNKQGVDKDDYGFVFRFALWLRRVQIPTKGSLRVSSAGDCKRDFAECRIDAWFDYDIESGICKDFPGFPNPDRADCMDDMRESRAIRMRGCDKKFEACECNADPSKCPKGGGEDESSN